MGKSGNTNIEAFKRINYLYQAAYMSLTMTPADLGLCRFFIQTLKTITKRLVLRLHPHMNRNFCKKCFVLLVPGVTATVRARGKREKHTVVRCTECGTCKRFLWRENHQLWVERPELWLDRNENS